MRDHSAPIASSSQHLGSLAKKKIARESTVIERELSVESLEDRTTPAALSWSVGIDLPTARGGVVGVEAPNATTLVIGGGMSTVPMFSASNPTWQTFMRSAGSTDGAITSPGVGIMSNGGILLFGGNNGSNDALKYDYTGVDSPAAATLHTGRSQMGFATDENHHIYAIGGYGQGNSVLSSVEWYNSQNNQWTVVAPLPVGLAALSAVADGNGHVYAIGGIDSAGHLSSSVFQYTIATNSWSSVASLPVATDASAAVLAPNGKIYVMGGVTSTGTTANVESYDALTNSWTSEAPLPIAVSREAAAVDSLGRIVVAGGFNSTGAAVANVWMSQLFGQPDSAPVFTSTAPTGANPGVLYSYQVLTTGNPQPTYSLDSGPVGMTIDPNTGLVNWSPTYAQEGAGGNTFVVRASNGVGSVTQTVSVAIAPSAPTGVTASGSSTSTISISWDLPTDPNVVSHSVYQRFFHPNPRGSGGTYTYTLLGTSTTDTFTISGLQPGKGGTYLVSAVNSQGIASTRSATVAATSWIAPSFPQAPYYLLSSGAVWSGPVAVTVGQTVQISLITAGNPSPTYSVLSGPSTVSINPNTPLVTYTPSASEVGTVDVTFLATNAAGSATQTIEFQVSPAPTQIVPTILWQQPSDIAYGTPLDGNQLNAVALNPNTNAVVSGTFTYMPDFGTIFGLGTQTLSVVFTPSDTTTYAGASAFTTVNVVPATPSIILNTGTYSFDGLAHAATASILGVDGVTPVVGDLTITYNGSLDPPTAPGEYIVEADFTSSDPNYASTSATDVLVINSLVQLQSNASDSSLVDLVWTGTVGNDQVRFDQIDATTIQVTTSMVNGISINLVETFTGITGQVTASADAGNDVIDGSGLTMLSAYFDGGAGNNSLFGGQAGDTLIGGSDGAEGVDGSNVIIGGDGADTIVGNGVYSRKGETGGNNLILGGGGDDTIVGNYVVNPTGDGGEGGHNVIVGGDGADTIYSSQGFDGAEGGHGSIIISGETSLDQTALQGVLAEWSSSDSLVLKMADIRGANGTQGQNGSSYLIPASTVSNDNAIDSIFSDSNGAASWLIFDFDLDVIANKKANDVTTNLG